MSGKPIRIIRITSFNPSLLLTRERIKLDKILLDEFIGSFELPLVDNFFYEPLESCDISGFRQFLDPPEKRVPPQK
jgi:hypothetical protein